MRNRYRAIDPVIAGTALLVVAFGLVFGFGWWAVLAGSLVLAASGGSRQATAWAARRYAMPPGGTQERALVIRALGAATTMRRLVDSVPDGPVAQRCREMERQARAGLPTIRALAVQAQRVRVLAQGIPAAALEIERAHTSNLLAGEVGERVRTELDSLLRSTEAQLRTGQRLNTLADELFARTRALTTSMEAVAAGLAELQALSSSDPTTQPQVALANLSREIEALRGGLEEAQTFGRRAAAIHLLEV